MSRFKISGNWYVSEWGGDNANAGTDPNLPKRTIANVPNTNGIVVIGSGVYKENNFGGATKTIIGDGTVIIDGLGGNLGLSNQSQWKNIWFKNVQNLGHSAANGGNENNIYENVSLHNSPGNLFFSYRSIFLPSTIKLATLSSTQLYNCIVLEQIIMPSVNNNTWSGSFISKNVIWNVSPTETFFNVALFSHGCVNGIISRNGLNYEAKRLFDGSNRPDADPNILDIIDVYPNFYNNGNFACVDPEFLDLHNKIVKPTSPLLRRSANGFFIGGVRAGKIIELTDPNFQFAYTRIDTTNPNSVSVQSGQLDGEIRITGRISDSVVSSRLLVLKTLLNFLRTQTAPTAENNNVPDAVKQLGLLATEIDRPRRLTYWMRTSLDPNANQGSPIEIWDNDGGPAGAWLLMEVNTEPRKVFANGLILGNGDPRGGGQIGSAFNFRSIDLRIVLDQNRI
ncbi:hypothetical protein [Mongoliitalea lutea]|uniref:Uncharacterized protein n=1 Tax=Mongoliitalea lutea TaxID=849756 RepID=A0A8J3CZI8_9BACT|nr:hypothetical protein [Mongoliitalea lutea]GHB44298.1 hypothetical protein GCM10008106_26660 [Mongoliitalea lutea]